MERDDGEFEADPDQYHPQTGSHQHRIQRAGGRGFREQDAAKHQRPAVGVDQRRPENRNAEETDANIKYLIAASIPAGSVRR